MTNDEEPSQTAFTAAAARAAHLIVDDDPPIFADTLASAMLGDRAEEFIAYHRDHGAHPVLCGARAQATCRSRYTEDSLARGIGRGITQYVILGAGLDSFAQRSALMRQVRVFEVDHPATQEWKRGHLPAGAPANGVTFVTADLTTDSLGDQLCHSGFDPTAPALVAWLGVTMYLPVSAIEQTLSVVGGFAPGTELIADYMLPPDLRDAAGGAYADLVAPVAAERGEPWLSFFAPGDMTDLLRAHGLGAVRHVRQRDMIPAALWDRADSLRPAELSVLAHAVQGG